VIELSGPTRRDNLVTFPQFRGLHEVPRFGVSVGPATIATHSHAAILVLLGASKTTAFDRITGATHYDPDWPASVVLACTDAQVVADEAAAGATPDRTRD
jgi:glucosamine-6-phosphate deaminase